MTVKSDKSVVFIGLLCLLPFLFLSYLFFRNSVAVGVILIVVPVILCGRFLVAVCRTFQFDDTGITISFFRFRKLYAWNEVTMHRENYENRITFDKPQYKNCICFQTTKMHKPRAMQPLWYCLLVHPFGFVFVNFDLLYQAPEVYPVDGECFANKCEEWQNQASCA